VGVQPQIKPIAPSNRTFLTEHDIQAPADLRSFFAKIAAIPRWVTGELRAIRAIALVFSFFVVFGFHGFSPLG
jgi:hypothetical protein